MADLNKVVDEISGLICVRKVKGGRVSLSKNAPDQWVVDIYYGRPRRGRKFGNWRSGRVFSTEDSAVTYYRECVKK